MIEYDFDPLHLPAPLLQTIGLAVTSAAQTEEILNMAIGGCLGIDSEYNIAVTAHMAVPLKFSVLRSVTASFLKYIIANILAIIYLN